MNKIVKVESKKYELATKDQFLKDFTVKSCMMKFSNVKDSLTAFQQQVPSMAKLYKEYGQEFIIAYVEYWLDNLNDFINASRKMTPDQIGETAILLYQYYPYLNIADINLIFKRIKSGDFGKLYESIDGVKILEYCRIYVNERSEKILQEGINQDAKNNHNDYKRTSDTSDIKTAFKQANGFEIIRKDKKDKLKSKS